MIDPTIQLEIDIKTYFTCLECKLVLLEPQEKQCCGGLVCSDCCTKFKIRNKNRCSQCNRDIVFKPNAFARRVLNQLKSIKCIYDCGEEHDFANLRDHLLNCQERMFNCQENGCNFSGTKNNFKIHYIDNHDDKFFDMLTKHKNKYALKKIEEKQNYIPFIPKDRAGIMQQNNKDLTTNSFATLQNNNININPLTNISWRHNQEDKFGPSAPAFKINLFPFPINNSNKADNISHNPFLHGNTNFNFKENISNNKDNQVNNTEVSNDKQPYAYNYGNCDYSDDDDYYNGYSYGSNSYSY